MRVLKIILEGVTTSFRYPHFMFGVQPTFPMPPPATIYGHICSTLGDWFDPSGVSFAYHFTAQAMFEDLEHVHILSAIEGRSKLPGTEHPKVLDGSIQPFRRQMLFQPRMVLYLNRPEWESAFRSPVYPVVLGRSQDLCTYTDIQMVDLVEQEEAYLEHTLLPFAMATRIQTGVVTLMPRFVDYTRHRRPTFERYLLLQRAILSAEFAIFNNDAPSRFWTDPTVPEHKGFPLGLVFHTFTGGDHDPHALA